MFARQVKLNGGLSIGTLNSEKSPLEGMGRSSLQQRKRLEEKLSESYAENRNLQDMKQEAAGTHRSDLCQQALDHVVIRWSESKRGESDSPRNYLYL